MIRKLAVTILAAFAAQAAVAGDFNIDNFNAPKAPVATASALGDVAADKYDFLWKYSPN